MDRDKLKEKIARAICQKGGRRVTDERWAEWLETWRRAADEVRKNLYTNDCLLNAEAALTAIEASGFVLMPKDQILRKMSKDEFSELMAGVKFKEPSNV